MHEWRRLVWLGPAGHPRPDDWRIGRHCQVLLHLPDRWGFLYARLLPKWPASACLVKEWAVGKPAQAFVDSGLTLLSATCPARLVGFIRPHRLPEWPAVVQIACLLEEWAAGECTQVSVESSAQLRAGCKDFVQFHLKSLVFLATSCLLQCLPCRAKTLSGHF